MISRLKKAFTLPPRVVAQKVGRKIKKQFFKNQVRFFDLVKSTYSTRSTGSNINSFIQKIELSRPLINKIQNLNKRYVKHEFDLLGSGWSFVHHRMKCKGLETVHYPPKKMGQINKMNRGESKRIGALISSYYIPIDWQIDFKSGYRWSERSWSESIRYGNRLGADVKVPWELSRMQHLVSLAWEGEEKRVEFQNQVLDFIGANPPRYGVNWSCTMDVGIRISNWLIAFDLFRAQGAEFDPEFITEFVGSVYEHGLHIFHHLEWDPYFRSNHYLANIAGLLFVASYLPSSPEIDSWYQFAIQELIKEVFLQFHPDGSNFEASTSYHRLSTEMVVYATALCLQKGVEFPADYLDRIQKMGDFLTDITKPDGTSLQFGDNDSGRFIKMFPDENRLNYEYLVSAIRSLKGLSSIIQAQILPSQENRRPIMSYPDFGLYIQEIDPWFCAARCGSIGQKGNGGHAHNDQLSFELSVHRTPFVVDPGTYLYTPLPDSRRYFRSTQMHNTLVVEGLEQNQDQGLFSLADRARAALIHFEQGLFIGQHQGFGAIHRRVLKVQQDRFEGVDECDHPGLRKIYFHLAPGWEIRIVNEQEVECIRNQIKIRGTVENGVWGQSLSFYSPGYGEKQAAPVLIIQMNAPNCSWVFLYCDHSKNVNLPRRRLEFESGAAGAEAAKLEKFSDGSRLEFNGCLTLVDSHFLSSRSITSYEGL